MTAEKEPGKPKKFLKRKRLLIVGATLLSMATALIIYFASFDRRLLEQNTYSTTFYDRNGTALRTFFSQDETYSEPCRLSEITPHFTRAIVLIEDKTFYNHKGIVLSSLVRALWQNVKGKRVVSGGSTITMQLAKILYRHKSRTVFNKISEIFSALKFELHLSKSEIIEAYLNRLPFGNMIYGVKQAAYYYFNTAPSRLSLNQAIYLALVPKSPSLYNPLNHTEALRKRWEYILELFKNQNHITIDEYRRARSEGITFHIKDYPFVAPHFIELVKDKFKNKEIPLRVNTTLDTTAQLEIEGIIREHLDRLKPYNVQSAAAIAVDNRSHEVIAFIGAPDYFNEKKSGFVNLAVALRQPGSTLKPFVYGLALETGYNPSSILPDIKFPTKGGFFPSNHDGKQHGPLRLRIALACSYNIPAFYLAMKLKPDEVIRKLKTAGFSTIRNEPGFYGETIALGSGEVRLLDLVTAYSAFANRGIVYKPAFIKGEHIPQWTLFDERVAFLIWDILADPSARFSSFGYDSSMNLPFPAAIKTGTSKGFRDKWAVGVNSLYTVGVWIGNPNGENMKDTTEVGNVPTIVRDIFLALQKDWTLGSVQPPDGIIKLNVCALSGLQASPACPDTVEEYFDTRFQPNQPCTWHLSNHGSTAVIYPELYRKWASQNNNRENMEFRLAEEKRISFPQRRDFFFISNAISRKNQEIRFEIMGFKEGDVVDYYVDGKFFRQSVFPAFPMWPLQRGDHTLTIKMGEQTIDSVSFIVR